MSVSRGWVSTRGGPAAVGCSLKNTLNLASTGEAKFWCAHAWRERWVKGAGGFGGEETKSFRVSEQRGARLGDEASVGAVSEAGG